MPPTVGPSAPGRDQQAKEGRAQSTTTHGKHRFLGLFRHWGTSEGGKMSVAHARTLKGLGEQRVKAQGVKNGKKGKIKAVKLTVVGPKRELTARQKSQMVIQYRLKARKLARSILRKWRARLDAEEVDSVVDLSLCEAVRRFDPTVGASFMTFLFYHLRGNLIRAVSYAATAYLAPIDDEAAFASDLKQESFHGVSAIEVAQALTSTEQALPDEVLFQKEVADLSRKACINLDELEREVIERIFLQGEQLIQVAESLGYSRCHISRVKKRALHVLHGALSSVLEISSYGPELEIAPKKEARQGEKRRDNVSTIALRDLRQERNRRANDVETARPLRLRAAA